MKSFTPFGRKTILLSFLGLFLSIAGKPQQIVENGSSVTFTDVDAVAQDTSAFVQWTVDGQSKIKSYAVEKSVDGLNFMKIGEIPASALQNIYNWTDTTADNNSNMTAPFIYYRIRSIGDTANVGYSKEVEISYGNTYNSGVPDITAFPNPIGVGQAINLQTTNIPEGVYTISLVNMEGQRIWIENINHALSSPVESIIPGIRIEPGPYFITIIGYDRYKFTLKVLFI